MISRQLPPLEVFSLEQIAEINNCSLQLLKEHGVEFHHQKARELLQAAGCTVEGKKVFFPKSLIKEYLAYAPQSFTLQARNKDRNVEIGNNNTVLAPGYGAPFVMELPHNKRRRSNYDDYVNFTRLCGASANYDVVGGVLVEPNDIPDRIRHGKMIYGAVKHTDKCLMGSSLGAVKAQECLEMAALIYGGMEFVQEHCVLISLINSNSPLQFDQRMTEALMVYAQNSQPIIVASLSMTGTTAPVTVGGALIQQNAEILAGIVLAQVCNKGAPVVFGSASSVIDLRTGNLAIGSAETAKMFAGTAQLARYHGLPSRGGGALTDALVPDVQCGYESMFTLFNTVLAGFNFVLHGGGLLENYMTMSYEKFIIDDEIATMITSFLDRVKTDQEHLGLATITKVGSGGNYLAEEHTYQYMREMMEPAISFRQRYLSPEKIPQPVQKANACVEEILANYQDPEIDEKILSALREYIAKRN